MIKYVAVVALVAGFFSVFLTGNDSAPVAAKKAIQERQAVLSSI